MRQPAKSISYGPPVGGWDARNALADMPIKNAVLMDNFFPSTDRVTLRRGSTEHASITGGHDVKTLMEYIPPSGTKKLFAGAGTDIYDVTASGTATAQSLTLANGYFVTAQFSNPAGHHLFAANGVDAMQVYSGSSWAAASISASGFTLANVAWVSSHQNRLWFGEKNSLKAWYLAVQTISGTALGFDLSSVASRGGYIVGMGTWTRDGGSGADDLAVFLTSEGEAIIYAGTDPNATATWGLVGVFRIGRPLNRRCMVKAGSDLVVATEDGVVPLSRVLSMDRSQTEQVALSTQIDSAFADAVRLGGINDDDWQVTLYTGGTMLVVNVPVGGGNQQYVFNTITGAPCKFTGMDALCWGLFDGELYFGDADGKVVKADDGEHDRGVTIVGDAVQAFSYFRAPGRTKAFKRVEALFESEADPQPVIDVMTDFKVSQPSALPSPVPTDASAWGTGVWDDAVWGGDPRAVWRGWSSVTGHGYSAAIRVRVNSRYSRPAWVATNWLYVPGGSL